MLFPKNVIMLHDKSHQYIHFMLTLRGNVRISLADESDISNSQVSLLLVCSDISHTDTMMSNKKHSVL